MRAVKEGEGGERNGESKRRRGDKKRRSVPQEDTIAPPRTYCMVEITRVRLVVFE
jgi:hypothetical protein